MERKIHILTGKIQSGKTTRLFSFIKNLNSVDGFLTPVVNDKRMLYHIASRRMREFETDESQINTISVGKYHFLNESFNWANSKLLESIKGENDWIIIDEIGKLELLKEGFHESADYILKNIYEYDINLLLVIRDYLLKEVLEFYSISEDQFEILEI